MKTTIQKFGTISVLLNLFGISKGLVVTLYEKPDFKGSSVNLNLEKDKCQNIHNTLSIVYLELIRIGSVNTHGSCVLGWVQQTCAGHKQELLPGITKSVSPQTRNGLKSISLCPTSINRNNGVLTNQRMTDLRKTAASEHNKYRKRHNAPSLRGEDQKTNRIAQNYADYLAKSNGFDTPKTPDKVMGEIMLRQQERRIKTMLLKEAIKNCYAEANCFNYNRPGFSSKAGHFTALVWKNTKIVGIGVAWSPQKR